MGIVYLGRFLEGDSLSAASRRVRDIARGLTAHGHEVSVIVPRRDASEVDTEVDGIRVRYIGGSGNRILQRLRYWKELATLSRRGGLDWVLFYVVRADAFLAMRRLKKQGVRVATIISDKHSAHFKPYNFKSWTWGPSIVLGESLQPRVSDLNICISRNLMDFCKRKAPGVPRILLPVLVDTDRFLPSVEGRRNAYEKWGLSEDDIVVAYLGGLWKHHGVRDLMVAFSRVAGDYPNARLLIAGQIVPAETHDNVVKIAEELDLKHKTVLTGWVGTQDVVDLYNRADILAVPQHDVEATNAGLPTKIAEYAAMGKALVATRTSDIEVYFCDHRDAILFEAGRIDALKAALVELIEDAELRERIGKAAAVTARRVFDYRVACEAISDYFNNDEAGEAVN